MALTYKQRTTIYLVALALVIANFLGLFDFITKFKLEILPLLSVETITGIGLLYIAVNIYKNQVDYY